MEAWKLLVEHELYKRVIVQIEPYITENMNKVSQVRAKNIVLPVINQLIEEFSKEHGVEKSCVIEKLQDTLRKSITTEEGEFFSLQLTMIIEVLEVLEFKINNQLDEKD